MGKILYRKSATKWDQNSESALLEIWNGKMEDLRGCRKNRHILLDMVAELKDQGYKYTLMELKSKMHNLTYRYRTEKNKTETNGSPSEWDLYDQMEILLTQCNKTNIENPTIDSINNHVLDPLLPQRSLSPLPSSPVLVHSLPSSPLSEKSTPSARSSNAGGRRKTDLEHFFKSVLKSMKQIHNDIKKTSERMVTIEEKKVKILKAYVDKETSERMVAIEEEKVNILKAYVDKEAEVQDALVDFLRNN